MPHSSKNREMFLMATIRRPIPRLSARYMGRKRHLFVVRSQYSGTKRLRVLTHSRIPLQFFRLLANTLRRVETKGLPRDRPALRREKVAFETRTQDLVYSNRHTRQQQFTHSTSQGRVAKLTTVDETSTTAERRKKKKLQKGKAQNTISSFKTHGQNKG